MMNRMLMNLYFMPVFLVALGGIVLFIFGEVLPSKFISIPILSGLAIVLQKGAFLISVLIVLFGLLWFFKSSYRLWKWQAGIGVEV